MAKLDSKSLENFCKEIRNFIGTARKFDISRLTTRFKESLLSPNLPRNLKILASYGEDAAIFRLIESDYNTDYMFLFATDSIMELLVEKDPYTAGYFCVLVNVNDIVCKGVKQSRKGPCKIDIVFTRAIIPEVYSQSTVINNDIVSQGILT